MPYSGSVYFIYNVFLKEEVLNCQKALILKGGKFALKRTVGLPDITQWP